MGSRIPFGPLSRGLKTDRDTSDQIGGLDRGEHLSTPS
jgi:hypothetical protein